MDRKPRGRRKLLVASIGVATMTYVGTNCGGATSSIPNGSDDGAVDDSPQGPMNISGNLVAPVPMDARTDARDGTAGDEPFMYVSGNLVAPVPMDAQTADSPPDAAPEDSATDTGPSTVDVINDWPIANLIAPPLDGGA